MDNRARARAVLDRTGHELFEDATTEEYAAVRHKASGLECQIPVDGEFSIEPFPPSADNPGLFCDVVNEGVASRLMAVYYGSRVPIDTVFSQALSAILSQASPQLWRGQTSAADLESPDGLPHFRIARYEATIDARRTYVRVAIAETRGWYLQQIVNGPLEDAAVIEEQAGTDWRRALAAFEPTL